MYTSNPETRNHNDIHKPQSSAIETPAGVVAPLSLLWSAWDVWATT